MHRCVAEAALAADNEELAVASCNGGEREGVGHTRCSGVSRIQNRRSRSWALKAKYCGLRLKIEALRQAANSSE